MKKNNKINLTSASNTTSVPNITKGLIDLQDKEYKAFHEKLMPTIDPDRIIGVRTPMLRNYAKEIYKRAKQEVKNNEKASANNEKASVNNEKASVNNEKASANNEKASANLRKASVNLQGNPDYNVKSLFPVRQELDDFLDTLPHQYYEENNLHFVLLELKYKDLKTFLEKLELFLPHIDNWATCDMISAKVFRKDLDLVYQKVLQWVKSEHTYTVRFGVVTLLKYYLDDSFDERHLQLVAEIKSEEYYINMAIAWYFSIALVKQYESTIGYFENPVLEKWTHNKAIQKAIESYRIDADTKDYLRTLKIK